MPLLRTMTITFLLQVGLAAGDEPCNDDVAAECNVNLLQTSFNMGFKSDDETQGGCPHRYTRYIGDFPGWGNSAAGGSGKQSNIEACKAACDAKSACKSFEYSTTSKTCNRNTAAKPTNGPYGNYYFCSKQPPSSPGNDFTFGEKGSVDGCPLGYSGIIEDTMCSRAASMLGYQKRPLQSFFNDLGYHKIQDFSTIYSGCFFYEPAGWANLQQVGDDGANYSVNASATAGCANDVSAKTRVVSACRQTIKKKNLHDFFQIIQTDQDIAP